MKVILIKGGKETDITRLCGGVTLANSLDTLGSTLDFTLARNIRDDNFLVSEGVEAGDFIRFQGEEIEMFFGTIVDMTTTKHGKAVSCLDFSFYLNNNKMIKQYKGAGASTAIEGLCNIVGVPVGSIDTINTSITKIYRNMSVAEIIEDILALATLETGNRYRVEMNGSKLYIKKYMELKVEAGSKHLGNISKRESILDMKNSVIVTSNNQDDVNTLGEAKDDESIKKYGLLQEIIEVDPKNIASVKNMARKKLEESNKVATTATIEVLGSDYLRSGRRIDIKNDEFGIEGEYLILSCSQTFEKGNQRADLEVEMI